MNSGSSFLSEQELGHAYRVSSLIAGYIHQTLTPEEHDELDLWVEESDENMRLFEELTDKKNIEHTLSWLNSIDSGGALKKIKEHPSFTEDKKKRASHNRIIFYSIAAILLIAVVVTWLVLPGDKPSHDPTKSAQADIAPGGHHATLQTGNGQTILLDSLTSAASLNNVVPGVSLSNGKLTYDDTAIHDNNGIVYHTLQTPPGGIYELVLPDGSHAWLNAASSIYFPTAFAGNERRVSITGEVYFEVAKKTDCRFIVDVNGMQVEVLGTHFNINAYADEPGINTTLLEGKVKVSRRLAGQTKDVILQPGQQAQLLQNNLSVIDVDAKNIIGWQQGEFRFHDASIASIGRQLSRWYNIQFSYEGDTSYHFNADFSRNLPLSRLLKLLEETGRVHFTRNNNSIIARP